METVAKLLPFSKQIYLHAIKILNIPIIFYHSDGIVDDYVIVLLEALRKSMTKILVVSNGMLTKNSKNKLRKVSDEILTRENRGFDGWAYRYGLHHEGWDRVSEYDELVMFNHTIMGPVNSFDDMFEDMNQRDLDFWGITKFHEVGFDPYEGCEYGYLPEHIQSHFICVRKTLLNSEEFRNYWDDFPEIKSYGDAVSKHEAVFTKKFSDYGYKWDVYVQTNDLKQLTHYPLMFTPIELIEKRKCPIFKRKLFFLDAADELGNTIGNIPSDFMEFLDRTGRYDVNLIWDNILRTCNQADIVRGLNLRYILPSKLSDTGKTELILSKRKIALAMHLYFEDLIDDMYRYASYMPDNSNIFITTDTIGKKRKIEEKFLEQTNHNVDVRIIQNRGRDVSSILVGVRDIIDDYDLVCFVHDKKTTQVNPGTVGEGFLNKCFENVLRSRDFVNNVVCLFEENQRLGILSPPGPNHADWFGVLGNEWGLNFEETKRVAKQLGLTVPIDKKKVPIAPYGTMFWFRPDALKSLFNYEWDYTDFPLEPNRVDRTILHAVERIYPFVVQQEGYYPAILMSDYYASIECTNMDYYARTMNNAISDVVGRGYFHEVIKRLKDARDKLGRTSQILEERNIAMNNKYELELKSLQTMQYVDGLQKELADAKGSKYELELKTLETMQYVEQLQKDFDKIKGEKYELELKALETMQYVEQLQKKATLKYQFTKFFKKIE